jgi:hypothetical protein
MGRVASFFGSVSTLISNAAENWRTSVAEVEHDRVVNAFNAGSPTAEWVTLTVGDREMERRVADGWEVVVHRAAGEYDFGDSYVMRRRRDDLAKALNL